MGCNCGKKFTQSSNGSTLLRSAGTQTQQNAPKLVNSAPVPQGMKISRPAIVRGRV